MRRRHASLVLLLVFLVTQAARSASPQSPPGSAFDPVGLQPNRGYFSQLPFEAVDMVNGHLTLRFTDLVLPGNAGLDLRLTRTYNRDAWGGSWYFGFTDVPVRVGSPVEPPPPGPGETQDPWQPVLFMGDGSTKLAHPNVVPGLFVTSDFWQYDPVARTVSLPNGWVATYEETGNPVGGIMLVEVHDRFGNVIRPEWIAEGYRPFRLHEVEQTVADAGAIRRRFVSFAYEGNDPRLPSSMTYEGRTWSYTHGYLVPGTATYNLTAVQPPAGPAWTFAYSQQGFNGTVQVTLPTGGTVAYAFVENDLGGAAPKLSTITTGGRAVAAGTWPFTFTGTVGTVTTPGGRQVRYTHSYQGTAGPMAWILTEKALLDGGAEVARVATTHTGVPFPRYTHWTIPVPRHQVITQGGQTFTTDYDYSNLHFGDYLRPYRVTESSSTTGATRVTERTFDYGFTPYLTGKPASETVTVAGESFATSYAYDHATGFLESTTQAGVTTAFAPDGAGNTTNVTDASGHQTRIDFQWGVPQKVTAPQSAIVRTLYPDGTVASESRGGATTAFQYDGLGRVTAVIPPEGAATTTSYASDGTSVTVSRAGAWTTTTVDGFGRPIATENAAGVKTVTTYDVEGLKTFQSDPFTSGATGDAFTYDALGRVTSVTHADQSAVHYTYAGTDVAIEDENHHTTTQHWVAFGDPGDGRLAGLTDAKGAGWVYTYNALGSLTRVHGPEGPDRVWVYDGANHLASDTQPESGTTTYTYTAEGLLHTKTDAVGRTTTYTFDGNHRLEQIDAPGTAEDAVFLYDARDNRVRATVGAVETVFTYDAANRLTGREDRVQGQVFLTQFGYDSRDNLQTITYPSGRVVTYSYDGASRISQVHSGSQVLASQVSYHPSGALAGFTFGNLQTMAATVDERARPLHVTSGPLDLTYRYDGVGNVTRITDPRPDATRDFGYDALDRLTEVGGVGGTTFSYDAQGNRLTKGTGSSQVTYTYAAATNRLMSATSPLGAPEIGAFTYDPVGNLFTHTAGADTFTYTYTARNQMATARLNEGPVTSYTYDADGLRTVKSSAAGQQYYVHGLGGQLLAEYAALLAKTAPTSGAIGANTTVTLKWSGLPTATYEVCWDTSNNGTCDASWQSTGATSEKVLTGLTPGTYYWQARATTASGTATADNGVWWSFTVVDGGFMKLGPAPGATVGSTVTLQWTTVPDSGYWVCWDQTNNDSCDGSWTPNGGSASKVLENLAPGTYYWQAKAQTPNGWLDGDGGTWWSFTVSGSGGFTKLGPMNGVSGLTGDVNLQWSSVPDSGYWVCWDQIDNGICDTMWWPNGAGTIRQLAGLEPGTYYWQAKVWNGTSMWEADNGVWWAFTVGTPVITFGKQTPAAGAVVTTNAATFTWTTATGADFYEFCIDTVNNGMCDTSWQPAAQATIKSLAGLTDGVYYWQVRAQTASGTTQADVGAWWTLTVDAPDPVREYIYLGDKLLATVTLTTGTPVLSYYHTDVLGSVRAITSATGATLDRFDYLPFGESTAPMTGDPRKFTGKERDPETAFDYFEARYYRNVWGRFTTVDPGQASGSTEDPQGWNAYAYARNNPLKFVDPSGLDYMLSFDGYSDAIVSDEYFRQIQRDGYYGATFKGGQQSGYIWSGGLVVGTYRYYDLFAGLLGDIAQRTAPVERLVTRLAQAATVATYIYAPFTATAAGCIVFGCSKTDIALAVVPLPFFNVRHFKDSLRRAGVNIPKAFEAVGRQVTSRLGELHPGGDIEGIVQVEGKELRWTAHMHPDGQVQVQSIRPAWK